MKATLRTAAALAALALAAPAAARAQGCIGAPVPERARALQLQAGVSKVDVGREFSSTDLGVGYRANPGGALAYSVEYLLRSVGDGDSRVHTGNAALALRVPLPLPLVTVCARTGAGVAYLSDGGSTSSYRNVTVPAALVLELPLPVGMGRTLAPYVAPQFLWSQTTGEVFGFDDLDVADTGFGVEAGVGLRVNRFLLGAGGSWSDLDPLLATPAFPDRAFFARVGVLF